MPTVVVTGGTGFIRSHLPERVLTEGEWLWRALDNPATISASRLAMTNPRGFGLVRRDRQPTGTYAPLGWPCYGAGVVRS